MNKNELENVDHLIREALDQKNTEDMSRYNSDPSLFEMMGSTFQGRLRWVVWLALGMSFVYLGVAIYCATRFFDAETTKSALAWGGGAMFCMMTIAFIKVW
jgi:hypothetical protein